MSMARLFDHYADLYRLTETSDADAQLTRALTLVSRVNCAVVPARLGFDRVGPADTAIGRVELYLTPTADVQRGDVVRLTKGPESPSAWRVVSTARPRGHHVEAVAEPLLDDEEAP